MTYIQGRISGPILGQKVLINICSRMSSLNNVCHWIFSHFDTYFVMGN